MDGDKKELVQHLFDASNNNKKFQERFQSFLDQIPKPSGASAAPEKEKFFMNFFPGMFSSLKSAGLDKTLGLEDCCFNLVSIIKMKDELHVAAKIKSEKGEEEIRLFVFAEGREKRTEDQLQQDIENIGRQLKSNVTKVLIGREVLGEEDQKWKFKVLVEHKTGNDTPEIRGFKTIGCKVGENLESRVADLATGNFEDSRGGIKEIIKEAKGLYYDLKEKNLIQNSDKEAAQHGFISGMLMNFRYRYNLRLYLELLTGRGYSDIVLLVRGKSRSWTAIPIVMELKVNDNVENALTEASSYARGLRRNKMRLLTNSEYAICMGVNLNEQEDSYIISNKPSQIKRNEQPFVQSLLDIVYSDEKCKDKESQVKNLLGQLYYTFPSEQYTRYYLSRFLLGQLSLLKKPKKAESMSVYLFNHSGKDIKGRDIEGHLTTYVVVVKGQDS